LLKLIDVFVSYGKAIVLQNLNLTVEKGCLTAIVGANGAGKTTLLRTIMGLKKADRGSILFEGSRIDDLSPSQIARMGISLCPERRRILPEMTVLENLEIGAYMRKRHEVKEDLKKVFDLFPVLNERKNQLAGTLSGGEQQMLALGRALMTRPKVLMLDEPTLGLSPIMKENILRKINEIRKSGVTILLVEQDAYSALNMADKAYVLENGKIVLEGTGKELLRNTDVKKAYLGI
jgi:branched-chain amino acid transport system ATP-binding protein